MNGYIWNQQMECMPLEEMRALQGHRLVDCVHRMYGTVPYYTRRMDEAGIEP